MRARLSLRVLYDAPAIACRRVLRILPLPRIGTAASESLSIFPPPNFQEERLDRFGNRVLHLHHAHIERDFVLALDIEISVGVSLPVLELGSRGQWKLPSRAVAFSPELLGVASGFRSYKPSERAEKLNRLVFNSLEYTAQVTPWPPNASHVWTQKRGSCAEFAHVLLALGRASGLPARYVAGYGPASGSLHAWVEFGIEGHWHAFDPTHGRRAEEFYLPVAVGRDFYDCVPHQGSFRGRNAQLEMHCELKSKNQ